MMNSNGIKVIQVPIDHLDERFLGMFCSRTFQNLDFNARVELNITYFHISSSCGVHSRLGYYFWNKGIEDYVALDLGIYHDLLLFYQ